MTPSIPAGKYVWRDIRTTRAGSELEEEELIFKKGTKEVLAKEMLKPPATLTRVEVTKE